MPNIFPFGDGTQGGGSALSGQCHGQRGTSTMASRDDLGGRNVPAIDWLELFIWTLLITLSSALALVVMR